MLTHPPYLLVPGTTSCRSADARMVPLRRYSPAIGVGVKAVRQIPESVVSSATTRCAAVDEATCRLASS